MARMNKPPSPRCGPEHQLYRLLQQRSDRELSQLVESLGFIAAHDQVGHAGDSATCGIDATCAAEPAAQGQQGPDPTPRNTSK